MSFIFPFLNHKRLTRYFAYTLALLSRNSATHASALPIPLQRPRHLGTTFSQRQCDYLNLDYRHAFRQISRLGFDAVRLCSYWNEIEPEENQFDFTHLDWLLEESERQGLKVILAVGMKVPRWPEFHFPQWLSDRYETGAGKTPLDQRSPAVAAYGLRFVETVVTHTRNAAAIQYWQIENEPFTHLEITGGRFLSHAFVQQEVEQVRQLALPHQKILLTGSITLPFADFPEDEAAFQVCLAAADAIGINVYSKVPLAQSSYYLEPEPAFWQTLQLWQTQLKVHHKEAWIAEAQAEPWEPNQLVAVNGIHHSSSSPQQAIQLVQQLVTLGYRTILLWGCEYWYWHEQEGRPFWWQTMQQLIQADQAEN